ncbi:MAG: hypothetical protein ACKOXH_09560, partial [Aquirufa sp.]
MKKYLLFFCLLPLLSVGQQAPFLGAWGLEDASAKITVLLTEHVFSFNRYHIADRKFVGSEGGTWRQVGHELVLTDEWSSTDSSKVGKEF